jgi:hypothetical protein
MASLLAAGTGLLESLSPMRRCGFSHLWLREGANGHRGAVSACRFYKFVVKRLLGPFIKYDLDLDQAKPSQPVIRTLTRLRIAAGRQTGRRNGATARPGAQCRGQGTRLMEPKILNNTVGLQAVNWQLEKMNSPIRIASGELHTSIFFFNSPL